MIDVVLAIATLLHVREVPVELYGAFDDRIPGRAQAVEGGVHCRVYSLADEGWAMNSLRSNIVGEAELALIASMLLSSSFTSGCHFPCARF